MLHLIVTGRSLEPGHLRTTALSLVAHAGLLFAFAASRSTVPVREPRSSAGLAPIERVRYITASAPLAHKPSVTKTSVAKPKRVAAPRVSPFGKLAALSLSVPTVDLDTTVHLDDLDLTAKVADSADFAPRTLADAIGAALIKRTTATPTVYGAYSADAVDRIVTPLSDNPRPIYPRSLEAQGVEADFTVMFVVDSTGRVDSGTLEVPKNVHRMFADAVRYALSRARYLPATLGGRPVRQLVAQEFVFRMKR